MTRDFTPGSEWAYIKLYMGAQSVDKVLLQAVKPMLKELSDNGVVDKFFFLRFSDRHFHLRLRFHLTDPSKIGTLLLTFNKYILPYYAGKTIWNIQMDTYKREIERYGAQNIETIEDIYYRDSVNTLSFLEAIKDSGDKEELRWIGAVRYVDDILDHFGCSLQDKSTIMGIAKKSFLSEFGMESATYTKPINTKYRTDIPKIEAAIRMSTVLFEGIHANNMSLKPYIDKLQSKDGMENKQSLILDVIHLAMNRIFVFDNRKHEMVLYYYLSKFYESQISKMGHTATT